MCAPTKRSWIACVGLAAGVLASLGERGVSLADDAVKKDVGAAVAILSTIPETQSDRAAEALAMVKRHEQKQALAELIGWRS
jgi:hypothetical protein